MARRPEADERLLVPACSGVHGERFFIVDLARYLGISWAILHKYGRRHRMLHWASLGAAREPAAYVTELGALRLIAFARVRQGAWYVKGKDYHALSARKMMLEKAYLARKRERAKAEADAQAVRAGILRAPRVLDEGSTK
jgi:hypothetical protein